MSFLEAVTRLYYIEPPKYESLVFSIFKNDNEKFPDALKMARKRAFEVMLNPQLQPFVELQHFDQSNELSKQQISELIKAMKVIKGNFTDIEIEESTQQPH